MQTLTFRAILERATVLHLLREAEFEGNLALQSARDVGPASDHYFIVFVYSAEPHEDGSLLLRVVSTTVLGIQRYTTTRLRYQGVYAIPERHMNTLLWETLRAHYRANQDDTLERVTAATIGVRLPWSKNFWNGAGELASSPEFLVADPDLEELERLFRIRDPRSGPNDEYSENADFFRR